MLMLLLLLRAGPPPPSMLTQDIPRIPIPTPRVLYPAQSTTADHQPFTGQSTVQVDYIQRDRDPDGNKVTALGNKSNVQLVCLSALGPRAPAGMLPLARRRPVSRRTPGEGCVPCSKTLCLTPLCVGCVVQPHGPDTVLNLTHMTSTYDLSISHVEGPRRVDTLLWSGVTKVDNNVPTAVHAKTSLHEKKRQEWAASKESNWQTAYNKQYLQPEGAQREMRGVIQRRKDDANFSKDKRPHIEMGLRGYS